MKTYVQFIKKTLMQMLLFDTSLYICNNVVKNRFETKSLIPPDLSCYPADALRIYSGTCTALASS